MKVKILAALFLFAFISSCSSIEFVYKNMGLVEKYINKTKVIAHGDESEFLTASLTKKFGTIGRVYKYILRTNIKINETVTSTNQDQSATGYLVNIIIQYDLTNDTGSCLLYSNSIKTSFTYNAKSEGYNFGTEQSLEKNIKQNINKNLEIFLQRLSIDSSNQECE